MCAHVVEEFIPCRDAGDDIDPLDLESGCLVLDLCHANYISPLRHLCATAAKRLLIRTVSVMASATAGFSCMMSDMNCLRYWSAIAALTSNRTKLTTSLCDALAVRWRS